MTGKLYHLGYNTPASLEQLKRLMADPKMLLIDTRLKPFSWNTGWTHCEIEPVYGKRYRRAGDVLGNKNYKGGPIDIINLPSGVDCCVHYLTHSYNLCLLCQCADYDKCHRKVIVDAICDALPGVEVIGPEPVIVSNQPDTIKALSIRQPYASWLVSPALFVAAGIAPKVIENRDWDTAYRGPILIHASKSFEHEALAYWNEQLGVSRTFSMREKSYPIGAIVGCADLVDVVTESDDPWFLGDYGFVLSNARSFKPIPYRGKLKLFSVPCSIVAHAMEPIHS